MENVVTVSVVCLAYNHEKYIRQTLDGFVSQITDFNYEVIVHDDASTDGTNAIIREYAEKHPAIIKPVVQIQNQYSKGNSIHSFTAPHVTGKYVALCEGDDYWIDPYKLQKQFEVMEMNPDCSICTHKIRKILENGTETNDFLPNIKINEGKMNLAKFLKIQKYYPFHTASYFMRAELWKDLVQNPPAFRKASDVGDEPMLLFMLAKGNLYYLRECMSVYRIFSEGSWSSKNKRNSEKRKVHVKKMYNMMCLFDEYTNHCFDCNLNYYQGKVLLENKEYKTLLTKEYRQCFELLPVKHKLLVCVSAVCPFLGHGLQSVINWIRRN